MAANDRQVGGSHYKGKIEHWDYVWSNGLDYFQGQITKYVSRWKKKSGIQDLYKAKHFLEKYIELVEVEDKAKEAARALSAGLQSASPGKNQVAGGQLSSGYPPEAYAQAQAGMRNCLDPVEILRDGWKNT